MHIPQMSATQSMGRWLMGEKGEDTRTLVAALGDVMCVETWQITAIGNGMKIQAEFRRFGQHQRCHMRQPSRQQPVLMPPLCAVGGVRGEGRLREDIEPSEQPECLIKIKVTNVTVPFLVQ